MTSSNSNPASILIKRLNNGVFLPAISLGSSKIESTEGDAWKEAVNYALKIGYKGIDDAWVYKNEEEIGNLVQKFSGGTEYDERVQSQKVTPPRNCSMISEQEFLQNLRTVPTKSSDDRHVFVTSKIWVTAFEKEAMKEQLEEHLRNFKRSSCDLLLLHWPGDHEYFKNGEDLILKTGSHAYRIQTWRQMEELYREGKCRAIGVSNYMAYHMGPLIEDVKARQAKGDKNAVMPAYNQIEINPFLPVPADLEKLCDQEGIVLAAYRCLGGPRGKDQMMGNESLVALASKHGCSVSTLILRWCLEKGYHILPKSSDPARLRSNLYDTMLLSLSLEDVKAIDQLGIQTKSPLRFCSDPNEIK